MRTPRHRGTALRTLLAGGLVVALASLGHDMPRGTDGGDPDLRLTASGGLATPRNFTGYGFDQCEAPTQAKMDTWRRYSPFWGVGIYISGNSRACRTQANLDHAWVSTQLRRGWRLLPITLGPQASCSSRYPKYGWSVDPTINPDPSNNFGKARRMGSQEAEKAVAAAKGLGIVPGSTLWYDLEAWDYSSRTTALARCHKSALRFVHAWTRRLHSRGYKSGFYSSAASGIKMMDNARSNNTPLTLPDYLWIARWDSNANTSVSSEYLAAGAWNPHRRVKQYQGGHNETWGGVTINIDRNFLDVGRGSYTRPKKHCGGVPVNWRRYLALDPGTSRHRQVSTLQCLLKELGRWDGGLRGHYGRALARAVEEWKADNGFTRSPKWRRAHWMALTAKGQRNLVKFGSANSAVFRLQRTLNASGVSAMSIDGIFDQQTDDALRAYQQKVGGVRVDGITRHDTWALLKQGRWR